MVRSRSISSEIDIYVKLIETTFLNAGYLKRFISHTVNSFLKPLPEDYILIPGFLFGDSSCGDSCIGETMRNVQVRFVEHSNTCIDSEPADHLRENPSHSFIWRILCTGLTFSQARNPNWPNDPTMATQLK